MGEKRTEQNPSRAVTPALLDDLVTKAYFLVWRLGSVRLFYI